MCLQAACARSSTNWAKLGLRACSSTTFRSGGGYLSLLRSAQGALTYGDIFRCATQEQERRKLADAAKGQADAKAQALQAEATDWKNGAPVPKGSVRGHGAGNFENCPTRSTCHSLIQTISRGSPYSAICPWRHSHMRARPCLVGLSGPQILDRETCAGTSSVTVR